MTTQTEDMTLHTQPNGTAHYEWTKTIHNMAVSSRLALALLRVIGKEGVLL